MNAPRPPRSHAPAWDRNASPFPRSHAPAWERNDLADALRRHNSLFLSLPLLLLPLLLACSTPEQRCHDRHDLESCLSLCAGSDFSCQRDLASQVPQLAVPLLERACDARDAQACLDLSAQYAGPEEIDYLAQACKLDSAQACHQLSEAHLNAVPADWSSAIAATVRACHLLGMRGCHDADRLEGRYLHLVFCSDAAGLPGSSCAELDPEGSYGPPDRDLYLAIDARLRADCEAGVPDACGLGEAWAQAGFARHKAPSPVEAQWYQERK